jgi:hypothetical protein
MPGKHAAPSRSHFYRDLAVFAGGTLIIGAVVYLGLTALAGSPSTTTTTTAPPTTTTTTAPPTTASTTTTSPTTTTIVLRPPAEVRVRVLNAIGVAGLAREVSDRLAALGYQMQTPDNYQPSLDQTRIWYAEGFEAEAFELAVEFPDARVERNPDLNIDADIVVVIGESYEA